MWTLQVLGDLAVSRDGTEFRRFRATKYGHLLAFLAIHSARAHSREELLEVFWPEEPTDAGRTCLRTALASLRRQFGPQIFLPTGRDSVRIDSRYLGTDALEFERLVRTDPDAARSLYQGMFLPSCYEDWAQDERNRLEALFDALPPCGYARSSHEVKSAPLRVPTPITPFVGRSQELAALNRLLFSDENRLVVLTGLGGSGKTRLAIEVCHQLENVSEACFVTFTKTPSPAGFWGCIADKIAVDRSPQESLQGRVSDKIRIETRFIILDNLEHLVSEELAVCIQELLESCPALKVLATSRIPLGACGETQFAAPPLDEDSAQRLLLDRARRVLPDFAQSPQLAEICRKLDNHPLSLELCAARAKTHTAKRMLSGLHDRFGMLQTRQFFVAERHRSLDAVLDWSCPPEGYDRDVLFQMSFVRSAWTLELAKDLLGDSVEGAVEALLQRSLIKVESGGSELRFRTLETVRDFAFAKMSESQHERLGRSHSQYFLGFSRRAVESHKDNATKAFNDLEQHHSDVYAALEFGLGGSSEELSRALQTLYKVGWCWWVRGYGGDFQSLITIAAARIGEDEQSTRGVLAFCKGEQLFYRKDWKGALELFEQALPILLDRSQHDYVGYLTWHAVDCCINLKLFELAENLIRRALDRVAPDQRESYYIWMASLANLYLVHMDRVDEAESLLIEMKDFWERQTNWKDGHLAVINRSLACCSWRKGAHGEVEEQLRRSASTFAVLGERRRESETLRMLVDFLRDRGRADDALLAEDQAALIDGCGLLVSI